MNLDECDLGMFEAKPTYPSSSLSSINQGDDVSAACSSLSQLEFLCSLSAKESHRADGGFVGGSVRDFYLLDGWGNQKERLWREEMNVGFGTLFFAFNFLACLDGRTCKRRFADLGFRRLNNEEMN